MPWVRIDDKFYGHPKLVALPPVFMLPAVGLHLLALCYCNDHLTDGFIPDNQVPRLAGDVRDLIQEGTVWPLVKALIEVGMWESATNGFRIHDFLDYNPSRKDVLAERRAVSLERSKAGKKGNEKRWNSHRTDIAEENRSQTDRKPIANRSQTDRPDPVPVPRRKTKTRTPLPPASPVDLTQEIAWGKPGSLMRLYNEQTPPESPAVDTTWGKRAEKEAEYLRLFPHLAWWEETFKQFHRSRFLRGMAAPRAGNKKPFLPDFDWLLSKGKDDQIENCVKVHDGRYRD